MCRPANYQIWDQKMVVPGRTVVGWQDSFHLLLKGSIRRDEKFNKMLARVRKK